MTLLCTALFILAPQHEEKLNTAYERMTTTTSSLTFNTFTAGDKGNSANSHLLVANQEALLIDAQLTKNEARKLVKLIKKIGKPLKTIFITSAFPDRYLGLPVIKEAFPEARVIAPPGVAKEIKEQWAKAVARARAAMPGEEFADAGTPPEAWPNNKIELAGNLLQLIPTDKAETDHAAAMYVPSLNVLITGNLVNGKVQAPAKIGPRWLPLLDEVKKGREIGPVLTGRGDIGDASLIEEMKQYVKDPKKFPTFKPLHLAN